MFLLFHRDVKNDQILLPVWLVLVEVGDGSERGNGWNHKLSACSFVRDSQRLA